MSGLIFFHAMPSLSKHVFSREIAPKQRKVAEIVEMIHTASLIHDDVIDRADRRRMKPSINTLWGPKKVQ